MKVGDLVVRNNHAPELMGNGVVLDVYESDDLIVYYEVQWLSGLEPEPMWYGEHELKVISEGR